MVTRHAPHLNHWQDYNAGFDAIIDRVRKVGSSWDYNYVRENLCTRGRAQYLLIRVGRRERILVGSMLIHTMKNTPARFRSIRKTETEQIKEVDGLIWKVDQTIYTAGNISHGQGLRFTRLNEVRVDGRVDLCGVRLGYAASVRVPYAHRIYAYQLPPMSSQSNVRAAIGSYEPDALDGLRSIIPDIRGIVEALRFERPDENGLFAKFPW